MTRRFAILSLMIASLTTYGADYPQFRGPTGDGRVAATPPSTWNDTTNIAWKTPLPGSGWSQPIVVGEKLFVTAAVADKLARPKDMQAGVRDMSSIPGMGGKKVDFPIQWQLFALNRESGSIMWSKTVSEGKPQHPIHPSNTYATETPCADRERVYVYFGATGTLAAYSHTGDQSWKVELGAFPISSGFGSGSSPMLHDGKLYLANFNEKTAYLAAFDAATGRELWKQSRTKAGSSWASPLVWKNSQRTEIIACGDKLVTSHDPKTGAELWRVGGIDTSFAPSPAADGDLLLFGASSPFSSSPLFGIKAGATGDITLKKGETKNAHVAWSRTKGGVGMASPVAAKGYLYIAGEGGLICVDEKTGQQVYKERLPKSRTVTACPVVVGDKLLILDETGQATWVKLGPVFEIIDTASIKDTFWASPAVANDRIYLRGVDGVYCVGK